MHIESMSVNGRSCLCASGDANISHASRFHSSLSDHILTSENPMVDCSGLSSLDIANAQILLAARKSKPGLEVLLPRHKEADTWLKQTGIECFFLRENN